MEKTEKPSTPIITLTPSTKHLLLTLTSSILSQILSTPPLSLLTSLPHKTMPQQNQLLFRNMFRFYPVVLTGKQWLIDVMAVRDKIWGGFVAVFGVGVVRGIIGFNSGRPKVAMVGMYMEEEKIRKYYVENKLGWGGYWKRVIKQRNNGILLNSLISGISLSLSFGLFDVIQHFLPQQRPLLLALVPNILLATTLTHLSKYLLVPFTKLLILKTTTKITPNPEHPYLYSSQSYWNLIKKMRINGLKIDHLNMNVIWSFRTGLVLGIYQEILLWGKSKGKGKFLD